MAEGPGGAVWELAIVLLLLFGAVDVGGARLMLFFVLPWALFLESGREEDEGLPEGRVPLGVRVVEFPRDGSTSDDEGAERDERKAAIRALVSRPRVRPGAPGALGWSRR